MTSFIGRPSVQLELLFASLVLMCIRLCSLGPSIFFNTVLFYPGTKSHNMCSSTNPPAKRVKRLSYLTMNDYALHTNTMLPWATTDMMNDYEITMSMVC